VNCCYLAFRATAAAVSPDSLISVLIGVVGMAPRHHDVAVLHCHLRCRILVRDCRDRALPIPPSIHHFNVGWGLLVEKRSVDR